MLVSIKMLIEFFQSRTEFYTRIYIFISNWINKFEMKNPVLIKNITTKSTFHFKNHRFQFVLRVNHFFSNKISLFRAERNFIKKCKIIRTTPPYLLFFFFFCKINLTCKWTKTEKFQEFCFSTAELP